MEEKIIFSIYVRESVIFVFVLFTRYVTDFFLICRIRDVYFLFIKYSVNFFFYGTEYVCYSHKVRFCFYVLISRNWQLRKETDCNYLITAYIRYLNLISTIDEVIGSLFSHNYKFCRIKSFGFVVYWKFQTINTVSKK